MISPPLHRLRDSGAGEKGNEGSIKSAADLKGKKVGVGLGTNYEEWLRANVQGVDIRTYDDDPTKYQDLRVGRIDAILVDRLAALDLVKKPTIRWPLRVMLSLVRNPVSHCAKVTKTC
jgi:cystine transport system substrate-binding protein